MKFYLEGAAVFSAAAFGFSILKLHMRFSSTCIKAPALSN